MIGLDANLLVRLLVEDDARQTRACRRLLARECSAAEPGWINRIVLCELVWVLERVYTRPREAIADALEALMQTAELQVEDSALAWQAVGFYRRGVADFADVLLALSNEAKGCEVTVTLDRKAARLRAMRGLSS